jgi:hypothetical protein
MLSVEVPVSLFLVAFLRPEGKELWAVAAVEGLLRAGAQSGRRVLASG